MQQASQDHVDQLTDHVSDTAPYCLAIVVFLRRKFIGTSDAFFDGLRRSAGQLTQPLSGIGRGWVVPAYDAVHGSITVRPQPAKPPVSRVAMLAPGASAVAAISASNFSIGFPALRRARTISG